MEFSNFFNVNHVFLRGALVEVSWSYSIRSGSKSWSRNMYNVQHHLKCALSPEIPGGGGIRPPPQPILVRKRPTRIGFIRRQNTKRKKFAASMAEDCKIKLLKLNILSLGILHSFYNSITE